jgi:hypothetical protein
LPQHGILQMEIGLLLETLQGHNGGAAVITYLVNLNLAWRLVKKKYFAFP